jgi:hypothetical protein
MNLNCFFKGCESCKESKNGKKCICTVAIRLRKTPLIGGKSYIFQGVTNAVVTNVARMRALAVDSRALTRGRAVGLHQRSLKVKFMLAVINAIRELPRMEKIAFV